MPTYNSHPLPQARLLRTLEHAWIAVAGLATVALAAGVVLSISNAVNKATVPASRELTTLTNPDSPPSTTAPSSALQGSLLSDLSLVKTSGDAPSDASGASARPPGQNSPSPSDGTHVLAGASANTPGSGSKASIESQLGAWLTLDKCTPDLPIFASVRGQWRSANILFVRNSLVMVRFTDPAYSDEECAVSQLRLRSAQDTMPQAASLTGQSGNASQPKSSSNFLSGEWVEARSDTDSPWRLAAITRPLENDHYTVRFVDLKNNDYYVSKASVRPWDFKSSTYAATHASPPEKALVNLQAKDYWPGERVIIQEENPVSGTVVRSEGACVVVRCDDAGLADRTITANGVRPFGWAPYFERVKPLDSQIPGPQPVRRITSDNAPSAPQPPPSSAIAGDPSRPTPPDYMVVSPLNYKPEDQVQVADVDGTWKPARVKRVEGNLIILYPPDNSDKDVSKSFSQVRMSRELAQTRMRERMNASRAASGMPPIPPPPSSNSPKSRHASDFKPGLFVTTTRTMGEKGVPAKVISIDNDMVTAEYLSDGVQVTRNYIQFQFERSSIVKPASFYKPGDWVSARMYPDKPDTWYYRRVEAVEDGRIIMVWGPTGKDSLQDRAKLPQDVRPLKMADER